MSADPPPHRRDRSAALRRLAARPINGLVAILMRLGIHPNALTFTALAFAVLAAALIIRGQLPLAGLILLLSQPLDALDGELARRAGLVTPFGAVLDSTSDRLVDAMIWGAIGYHLAATGRLSWLPVALAALVGSLLVSYVRARSEGAGVATRRGWITRMERIVVTLLALWFPPLLLPGAVFLAVGSGITVLQRLRDVQQLAAAPQHSKHEVEDGIS
ncbi:MAG: CDP-alcohol phosphatidyltransferase family protein [Anaerolineaceae bacterium]|nr:CDP-alcohol phosphatidyltransferase family protein [Anaerolineaceae bacterium]